ncbi:MAG: response regulator [Magnetococcales bacterium]|nr:response regulator [Magnetococcales bacterium]
MTEPTQQPKILIVDDMPANIKMLVHSLRGEFDISVATNGVNALRLTESGNPDLVLLDIMMPKMDGYEVCRRLKANPNTKNIPIIFITAMDEESDETKGLELGAVDYITKPFSLPIVQSRVRTHLGLKQARERIELQNEELEMRNRFIRNTFGRYMSDEVVNSILDTPEGLRLGGEKKEVTVMMTDLRGFTALSERLSPEEVVNVLNQYLEAMTEIIMKYNGTINEFLGDGILTFFGAPVTRDDDAQRAVACALEMLQAMTHVNARNRAHGYPELSMGIGINTGSVVAGNIGSERRSKYAVVGAAINLTARIESYTVGGQLFLSENTLSKCGNLLRIDDQLKVSPKGVPEPITIYLVGGIGAPFNIQLPTPEEQVLDTLANSITIKIATLQGKDAGTETHEGRIVKLSKNQAEIETTLPLDRLDNVKMLIWDQTEAVNVEFFGKVTKAVNAEQPLPRITFTAIPPALELLIKQQTA